MPRSDAARWSNTLVSLFISFPIVHLMHKDGYLLSGDAIEKVVVDNVGPAEGGYKRKVSTCSKDYHCANIIEV